MIVGVFKSIMFEWKELTNLIGSSNEKNTISFN